MEQFISETMAAISERRELLEIISRAEAKARGLSRYFTGAACRNGHTSERLVCDGKCVECRRERHARYYVGEALERQRERDRAFYKKNAENLRKYQQQYRAKNPEKSRAAVKRSKEKNKDAVRKHDAMCSELLVPSYVAKLMGIPVVKLSAHLYELKRQQLEIHRLESELKRSIKELTNEQ